MTGCLTMDQAAARLHKSRRWLQDWLRDHPTDRYGEPFYVRLGRTKIFDENDVGRIMEAAREEERCRLGSFHRGSEKHRSTRPAASTSGYSLIEALKLAISGVQRGGGAALSEGGYGRSKRGA